MADPSVSGQLPLWATAGHIHTPSLPHFQFNGRFVAADTQTMNTWAQYRADTNVCINTERTRAHAQRPAENNRPSGSGARRNSFLHINIQQSGCSKSLCQQGRMLINLTNTGVRHAHDYKVLWCPAP